jgi:aspartate aminotransferase
MTKLASRAADFRPSQTLAMRGLVMRLRGEGQDIIPLLGGEPDYFTPENVKQAGIQAIRANQTKYTRADGTPELRQALSEKFKRDNNLDYSPEQIVISMGTKPILHATMLLVTDPGDEVIVPAPFWVSYPDIARIVGAVPVSVPGALGNGFRLQPEALERAITPRSRVLVLNSPNNPTGTIYTMEDLRALGTVLRRHPDVWVLADEIYEHIRFEGGAVPSMAAVPGFADRVVTASGFSKGYAMTGWRIGYAGGPLEIIRAIGAVVSQLCGPPNSISQAAGLEALTGDQGFLQENVAVLRHRRDIALQALGQMPGLACHQPEGAFYLFVDVSGMLGKKLPGGAPIASDEDFCRGALHHVGVALMPGKEFGLSPFFRLSYSIATEDLKRALERLRRYCNELV